MKRSERTPRQVPEAEIAGVRISHPDKVLYADQGLTKRDLADHYVRVADRLLPHLSGRPLSLVRCPTGAGRHCFFQKHAGAGLPAAIRRVPVPEADGTVDYLAVADVKGLVSLVQAGVLELHPWGARADDIGAPDRLVFDFDPGEGVPWDRVADAAREARQRLADLGLESFVKTTGGKGLHVVAPVVRRHGWDEVRAFVRAVAEAMERDNSEAYVTAAAKKERAGRIFIDYLRNGWGATAVAPYSTRARPGAPVAVPLRWPELDAPGDALRFTVTTLPARLASLGDDPWAEVAAVRQSITAAAWAALGGRP